MGAHQSRPEGDAGADGKRSVVRALFRREPSAEVSAEVSAEARAEFTVADIHNPASTQRAQTLWREDSERFCQYRNYFKNHHMSLAREVGRQTNKSKAELLAWVEAAVGPLEGTDTKAKTDAYTKEELLELAMVSAALSEYGEKALAKMYAAGELATLPNVPLHTHDLRMPAKQQACRDNSNAANKDKLEAAHYIGLEVMLRLNERLPVMQRMGAEDLSEILNHPSNLRLMLASSNQVLHKKVDAMLITAGHAEVPAEEGVKNSRPRKISTREYDRLVQIAKHAQDDGFQDAMLKANGHFLYLALREQFRRLDVGDRPPLWDAQKDKPELLKTPRSRSRSPTPTVPKSAPPAPAKKKDPEPRLSSGGVSLGSSPSKHGEHGTFSRLAAKIFHSHDKSRHHHTAASDAGPSGGHHAKTNDVVVKSSKAKNSSKRAVARGAKSNKKQSNEKKRGKTATSNQLDVANEGPNGSAKPKRKPKKPATRAKKKATARTPSDDDDSAEDSDYVDSDYVDSDYVDSDYVDSDYVDSNNAGSEVSAGGGDMERVLHVGPRGGKYYVNAAGKKTYVK